MFMKRVLSAGSLAVLLALQAGVVRAQSISDDPGSKSGAASENKKSKDLQGSWLVTVTPPGGAPPFQALVTFDAGGGVVGSAQGDVLLQAPPGVPPVATAAHGAWEQTAKREFLFTFRQIFYGADGSSQGGAKIRSAVTLNESGDEWSGQLKVEYFDTYGNVVFSGEGTMQATRIVAEPLAP